jgi:hypothetical protein
MRTSFLKLFALCFSVAASILTVFASDSPPWSPGFWWITENHEYFNYEEHGGGGSDMRDTLFYYKWVVQGIVTERGEDAWLIAIFPHNLPAGETNDHGTNSLCRIWIATNNLGLLKVEGFFREGTFGISGPIRCDHEAKQHDSNIPTIEHWPAQVAPLDVPILPDGWRGRELTESEMRATTNYDLHTGFHVVQEIKQTAGVTNGITVTLSFASNRVVSITPRIQKWTPDCPWWSEWNCPKIQAWSNGLWYARTIDWQGK